MTALTLFDLPPAPVRPHDLPRLNRRDWVVLPGRASEAAALLDAHHYLGALRGPTAGAHLLRARPAPLLGPVVGAAVWTPASLGAGAWLNPARPHSVLSLSRLCVRPDAPRNAASFLLAAAARILDRTRWPILLSYADPAQGHEGRVYLAAGWTCLGQRPGVHGWRNPAGLLVTRPREADTRRPLRAAELHAAGWTRVRAAPKTAYALGL